MAKNIVAFYGWKTTDLLYYYFQTIGTPTSDGVGTFTVPLNGSYKYLGVPNNAPTLKAVRYGVIQSFTIADWGSGTGEYCAFSFYNSEVAQAFEITILRVDATNFQFRVRYGGETRGITAAIQATSGSLYSWGTAYNLLVYTDGSNFYLEANGALVLSFSTTANLGLTQLYIGGDQNLSTNTFTVKACVLCTADSLGKDGRPDFSTIFIGAKHPDKDNAGTPVYDQWNNSGGTNKADSTDDLIAGNNDGETTRIADPGTVNTAFRQTLFTTALTQTDISAVQVGAIFRVTSDSKIISVAYIISDGTTSVSSSLSSDTDTAYHSLENIIYNTAPDGTSWDQTDLNNMQIGRLSNIGAEAINQRVTTMMAEVLSLKFVLIPSALGKPFHPGKGVSNRGRFYQTPRDKTITEAVVSAVGRVFAYIFG